MGDAPRLPAADAPAARLHRGPDPAGGADAMTSAELTSKAPEIGGLVRAAQLCGLVLSQPAQERAARIEEAALEVQRHRGGTQARDAFLRGMAPPHFDRGSAAATAPPGARKKAPAVQRMDGMLNSTEGTALVQRAEAAQASLR